MRSKEELIKYRIDRAFESLSEAQILANSNYWNTVVNRLYYASFYAINALFVKNGIQATTHSGVKAAFHKKFIKTKIIEKDFGRLYNNLFSKRQEVDYQDFQFFEKETIEPLIIQVEIFINSIRGLL